MKISKILVLALLMCYNIAESNAQKRESLDCGILKFTINSESFTQQFKFEENDSKTLEIIDSNYYFLDCEISTLTKKLIFNRELNYSPNKNNGEDSKNTFVIYNLERKKNGVYVLYFWKPYNNATLKFMLRKVDNHFKILKTHKGAF